MMKDLKTAGRTDAVLTDAQLKGMWSINRIRFHFRTMREKIDTANRRMSDINNFKLAEFMGQGIDRWTTDVKQAIEECEDAMVRDYNEMVAGRFDPYSG
jgi:hypothetical protein